MSKYNYDGSSQFKPISAWGYVGYSILFSIPIIGLVFLIVFAFSSGNINRRSYARSYFCWLLIVIIISVLVATGVVTGLINDSVRAKFAEVQNSMQTFVEKTLGIAPKLSTVVPKDDKPSVKESTEAEAPAKSESAAAGDAAGDMVEVQVGGKTLQISKSFKEAMDEYGAFFDEYIDVMERQDVLKMAAMTAKYAEMSEAFEKIDDDEDLSDAESAYYIHVQSQINEKLAAIGQ